MNRRDLTASVILYLVAFGIVFGYSITHLPVNDGVKEYMAFMDNIESGWQFRYSLVNSSLITTWLPAIIVKHIPIDQMLIFRIIPAIFYPLMPVFTYLMLRRYVTIRMALIGTSLLLLNSHFVYFPDIGRVGVSVAFMTGMIWALLERKIYWAIAFAILVVFSHYATSLIAFGLVGAVLVGYYIWKRERLKQFAVVLAVLVIFIGVWHFGIARYSGKVMSQTLFQTSQVGQILPVNPDVTDIKTREPAVQSAINVTSQMPIPQIIEIAANWIVVILITVGLVYLLRSITIDKTFKLVSLALYGAIAMTVALPWLSTYYGGMRVYFTATPVLSMSFLAGIEKASIITRLPILILAIIVLVLYGLSTTGIIYMPFGMEKTFPVVVEMP